MLPLPKPRGGTTGPHSEAEPGWAEARQPATALHRRAQHGRRGVGEAVRTLASPRALDTLTKDTPHHGMVQATGPRERAACPAKACRELIRPSTRLAAAAPRTRALLLVVSVSLLQSEFVKLEL